MGRWLRKCFRSRGRHAEVGPGSWAGRTVVDDDPRRREHRPSKLISLQPNSFGSLLRIGFPLYFRYSAGSRPNVPRRKARSLINTKKTGTRIST